MENTDKLRFGDLAICSQNLFFELAAHAHHFKITNHLKAAEFTRIPSNDQEFYFNTVQSLNYSSLFITLCKVMELPRAFREILPENLKIRADLINSRLARSKILDFRNKYAGHLFDVTTKRPIQRDKLVEYIATLVHEDSEEQFRQWWWSNLGEPQDSVASTIHEIRIFAADKLSGP